jgi:hypothetical protein
MMGRERKTAQLPALRPRGMCDAISQARCESGDREVTFLGGVAG